MFWIGLIVGGIIGGCGGVMTMALMCANDRGKK